MAVIDATSVRRVNRGKVLGALVTAGPLARSQIAERLGLHKATVSRVVDDLLAERVVAEELPRSRGGPGRQCRPVRFVAQAGLVCGVDVGASTTRILVSDLSATPVAVWRVDTPRLRPEALARWLADNLHTCTSREGTELWATAVGVPGVVRPGTHDIRDAQNLPNIEGHAFAQSLGDQLPGQLVIDNDANYAMRGELHFGAARGCATAGMLTVGTGIGAGLVVGGDLVRGRTGFAGEVAFLPMGSDGATIEDFAGGRGILEQARAAGAPVVSPAEVFKPDIQPALQTVRQRALDALVITMAALAVTIEPEVIVIGGGVAPSLWLYFDELEKGLLRVVSTAPRLVRAELADLSGTVGALSEALGLAYARLGVQPQEPWTMPSAEPLIKSLRESLFDAHAVPDWSSAQEMTAP